MNKKKESVRHQFKIETPVKRHTYPLEQITFSLKLVLQAVISMRACEKALMLMHERFGDTASVPDWTTVRTWAIKLGLYRLQRKKTVATDWAWLVDHSVR